MPSTTGHYSTTLEGTGSIHYLAAGQGPPVVLLHGLGASAVAWCRNVGPLSERYAVYTPDLPGHGDSAKPNVTYDLEFGVRFVTQFLDALGLERVTLIGNSTGGLLALATALRQPAQTQALVLVDSVGLGRELPWPLRLASIPGIGSLLDTLDVRSGLRFTQRIFHRPERIEPAVHQELHRLRRLPEVRRTVIHTLRSGVTLLGLRPSLVLLHNSIHLPVPTLVVWGQEDRVLPVEHAHRVARQLPNGQVLVLPDCGHWPQMEQAQVFNNTVSAFLGHNLGADKEPRSP